MQRLTTRQKVWGGLALVFVVGLIGSRLRGRDHSDDAALLNADLNTDVYSADGSTLVIKQPCKDKEAKNLRQLAAKYGFADVRCE